MSRTLEPLPRRPRLAEHVLARRHVIEGREVVVLHDQRRDDVVQIGAREWAMLEAADGTRDPEGILIAARREGAFARMGALRQLLRELAARGMVEAGEEAEPEPALVPPIEATSESSGPPLELSGSHPLVGQSEGLGCDGGGTCCRLYGTVMVSREEVQSLQSSLPQWKVGPVPIERCATPLRGSMPTPRLALIARDGACGFLQDDGLCAVHRVGGATAKPLGCRLFPRTFVDDGVAVHVSLKPECPCVLDPRTDAREPLVDEGWITAADLPPMLLVEQLPDAIELEPGRWAKRDDLRTWVAELARRSDPSDLAATLWALADEVGEHQLGGSIEYAWLAAVPSVELVQPWIAALYRRASTRAREHAAWRSERDLVRRISTAVATLALLLQDREALAEALALPPEHPQQERRYWRSALFGYRWLGEGSLVLALRDEALRIWIARSLSAVLPEIATEPDLRSPLALVEALMRAHGVGAYVDDL